MATPRWDEKNKRWQLNVQKDGKRRSFYSPKPGRAGSAEVRRKRQAWMDGQADKSALRLEKAVELYLEDVKIRAGDENYKQREKYFRLYITPKLGIKKMSSISEQDWQDVINKAKGAKPLSYKSLCNLRGSITDFCRFAKKSRMISERPEDLQVPKNAPKTGKEILQPDEVRALFAPSDEWYINAWRLMVLLGLRPGETYGLRHEDIKDGVLTIRRSISASGVITSGKNKNANREIKLPVFALELLSEQRAMTMHLNSPWTFCDPDGDIPNPNIIYKHWLAYRATRGIKASPYSFRHTFVSIAKGKMSPEYVKAVVGHSDSMDTFGVYGHKVDGEMEIIADLLDDVFNDLLG